MKQRNRILAALSLCFSSYILLLLTGFYSIVSSAQLQDPTRPPDFRTAISDNKNTESTSWTLSSVLISPERRVAIINGTAVQEGDTIGNVKVVRILAAKVLIEKGSEQIALTLIPETFRTNIVKRVNRSDGGHTHE